MHNNYFFLRQLTRELQPQLTGQRLLTCFSQQKDELILGFGQTEPAFYLKAHLTGTFSAISTSPQFERARRNTVDLFGELLQQRIREVVQHANERSFHLEFQSGQQLVFKLFGNRANIIFFREGKPVKIFNHQLKNDWDLQTAQLHRQLDFSRAHFLASDLPLRKLYPTLGDLPLHYLEENGYSTLEKNAQWELLQSTLALLENPPAYYLIELNKQVRLSLLRIGEILAEYTRAEEALNHFVRLYLSREGFQRLYHQWHQRLSQAWQQALQFISKNQAQLQDLQTGKSYGQLADVLMANLHQIPARAQQVELFNFYTEQPVSFRLKHTETPQKLAERYYRKARQQPQQIARLRAAIDVRELQALQLQEKLEQLARITEYRALKHFVQELETTVPAAAKPAAVIPFKVYRYLNFAIWVGRSAKNNDLLTQKYAHKDDLWLHAKDVPGSHVIIRQQAGKPFPQPLLEKAAQLAAWHSKRRTDSLCPVTYTPRKYVRKRKGAAAGEVVVEREKVLLVPPQDFPELVVSSE